MNDKETLNGWKGLALVNKIKLYWNCANAK